MLYVNKKLVEYYDTLRDPIKVYFMDKMQQVIVNFNQNKEQQQASSYMNQKALK